MADLILEPYAVRQRWQALDNGIQWGAVLGEYLESLARACAENKNCVIGHIKGLVLLPDGGFLRLSVVSPKFPASMHGTVPAGTTEIELSLNVIVYGLSRANIERIVGKAARELTTRSKVALQSLNEEAKE